MRRYGLIAMLVMLTGCQNFGAANRGLHSATPVDGNAADRFAMALNGDYDNHEQAAQGHPGATVAPIHMQHALRVIEHGHEEIIWLWRLRTVADNGMTSVWLYRATPASDAKHWQLMPYHAIDPALAKVDLIDTASTLKFVPAQWAALEPCAQIGQWENAKFVAKANNEACSALLPGLGKEAALLPLKLSLDGDLLQVATVADSTRGADAIENARRVRWFGGWAAINGGGPHAQASNQDWHTQRGLRLSSEGGSAPLRWRDGAASGYSVMLERSSYPERKLAVLQLNVVEDASGKTLTYAWTDAQADSIGLNLGWLQIGLQQEARPPTEH
jgi:hypothetical protein